MWLGVLGHDDIAQRFRRALARGRLASSFLFVGPPGIGKRTFALKLAQALLCTERPERDLASCGQCPSCTQVTAGTHPDLHLVEKPKDKSAIPLELLIGDQDHRMREGLCHHLALRPFMGGRRIAMIDDADWLNPEGANCLLKTLEEPPPRSVLILIGTSPARQLPTIRSRCQLVRFRSLSPEAVAELLRQQPNLVDRSMIERVAGYCEGSLERAREMADPELWTFRTSLYGQLVSLVLDSVAIARSVSEHVDAAGREASQRRQRLRQVVAHAAAFYRALLGGLNRAAPGVDSELERMAAVAVEAGQVDPRVAAARLDRCLEASEQVDRNANQATLIECWLDDLAEIGRAAMAANRTIG